MASSSGARAASNIPHDPDEAHRVPEIDMKKPGHMGSQPGRAFIINGDLDMPMSALARNTINPIPSSIAPSASDWIDGVLTSSMLSGSAKLLGLALANYTERTGGVTPTTEHLKAVCGFRSVDRLIDARQLLEARGFLRVERASGKITRYVFVEVGA